MSSKSPRVVKSGKKSRSGESKTPPKKGYRPKRDSFESEPRPNFMWIKGRDTQMIYKKGGEVPFLDLKPATTDIAKVKELLIRNAKQIVAWFNNETSMIIGPLPHLLCRDIDGKSVKVGDCPNRLACKHLFALKSHQHAGWREMCQSAHTLAEYLVAHILKDILVPAEPKAAKSAMSSMFGNSTIFGMTKEAKRSSQIEDYKYAVDSGIENKCVMLSGADLDEGLDTLIDVIIGIGKNGKIDVENALVPGFFAGKFPLVRIGAPGRNNRQPCGVFHENGDDIQACTFICNRSFKDRKNGTCQNYHSDAQSLATDLLLPLIKFTHERVGGLDVAAPK